jgi:hypothetical protein
MVVLWVLTDPSPTLITTGSIHLSNGGGQQTTERTRECGGGEKKGGTEAELLTLVPAAVLLSALRLSYGETNSREIVVDTREQSCLGNTEEEPTCQ